MLKQADVVVHGVRRQTTDLPLFMQKTAADVRDPSSLEFLATSDADTVVYSLAAANFNHESYVEAYITGLQNTIAACEFKTVKRLIFVSSTSVYHQNDGSQVDENSPTEPTRFNGTIMLEAEKLAAATGIATSVRFSGIYGPGRNRLIERVRNGQCTHESNTVFTNRIHSDDCSAVLAHLIMQDSLPSILLGSDSQPAKSTEVEGYIADQLGIEKRYADTSAGTRRIAGSKRCCNRLLLDTGFKFNYPDYKAGYTNLLQLYKDKPRHL